MPDERDPTVGDELTVVVTETNIDQDNDPIAQIGGTTCFLRYPEDRTPEFGEAVRVRIADHGRGHYVAAVLDRDGGSNE